LPESSKLDCGKPANKDAGNPQTICTETSSETSEESTKEGNLLFSPSLQEKKVRKQFVKPTREEVERYCREIGLTGEDGEVFFEKKQGQGWKNVKDWRATIRCWKLEGYHHSQKAGGVNAPAKRMEFSLQ
jgi:hypothetical protein